MERDESYRGKWAFGLATIFSVLILFSFAFYKGYLGFGGEADLALQKPSSQVANVVSADAAPSPIQNTKQVFGAAFDEISKQYQELKDLFSSVFVPFISNIEVYERK